MLQITYRPDSLANLSGNFATIEKLKKMLERPKEKIPHAFLFTGPTGCGKTTLGRIVAKDLGCDLESQDYNEVNSADFRGIDTIREIKTNMRFAPLNSKGGVRVWLIDECHKLTDDAQNALLKILEDPPPHVYLILCTTKPEKLIKEIKGRCSPFEVETLEKIEIIKLLKKVAKTEKIKISKKALELIAKSSEGHPRNALVILDQIGNLPIDSQINAIQEAIPSETEIIDLCRTMLQKFDWKKVRPILSKLKDTDPEKVRYAVLGYCNAVLLKSDNSRAFLIMDAFKDPFYTTGKAGLTLACYNAMLDQD